MILFPINYSLLLSNECEHAIMQNSFNKNAVLIDNYKVFSFSTISIPTQEQGQSSPLSYLGTIQKSDEKSLDYYSRSFGNIDYSIMRKKGLTFYRYNFNLCDWRFIEILGHVCSCLTKNNIRLSILIILFLLPMGVARSTIQDFQNKYSSYSADCYVKKDAAQLEDERSLFRVDQLILSSRRFTKLQRVVSNCDEIKQSYIKKIDDIYYEQKQEDTVKILLVYKVDGLDLFALLKNRQISGLKYKEEDALYMVECVCRAITEGMGIGFEIPFINSFSVYLTKQYTFKILMIPQDAGLKSLNDEMLMKQKDDNYMDSQRQGDGNLLKILNKQSNSDSVSINLFFAGLLCLKMLNANIQIARFYNSQKQQIDYHMISKVIHQINHKKLKWLLWLLLNQYPCERKEVLKQLNPLFVKLNYPKDILLRGTSLRFDIQYAQKKLISLKKIKQNIIPINKQQNPQQKVQNQQKCNKISKDLRYSLVCSKPQFNSAPLNLKFSTPNLASSSSFEQSPRQQTQLPSIKLKSWISEQTQISSLKNNSELCHSIKDIEASFKKENFTKFSLYQGQIKHADKFDTQLQTAQKQQQVNLSHYLSSQEESIILVNPDASDQQSEDAVRVDIDDFFGDLRTKKYSLNQNPCRIDYETKNPSPKNLFRKFSNSIIREESIQQSISGQQCEVDYVLEQYESGERYEGYKKNGHRNGYGKFYYSGGGIYEGDWKDNQMDGYGKLFYEESMIAYQGYWKKDSFHGKGKLYNQSWSQNHQDLDYRDLSNIDNYWKIYEGQFNQDEKQGYGRLTFSNGQEFRGIFKKDLINGEGHFIRKNGKIIQGFWNESLLIRQY